MNRYKTIFLHLPSYRDPEIIPTIKDAIDKAEFPNRLRFGICRQYHPDDKFDDLSEYKDDSRFRIFECLYTEAKGLPWARSIINEILLDNEDYVLQLDSHHRFAEHWDTTLINLHSLLEAQGHKPILTGYLPLYTPFNDPEGRSNEPWQQQFAAFYPHGTIFIRPGLLQGYESMDTPPMSRFLSGHFCFARSEWAKEIKHDPNIYFSGEELNLTVRSYTHGYDMFHPHKLVIWHSTMREERSGMLKWDDDSKNGIEWNKKQESSRRRVRALLRTEVCDDIDLTRYDLGTIRSLRDYEKYAGIYFQEKAVQKYTIDSHYPPNPYIKDDELWKLSFSKSHYHVVNITKQDFPRNDYQHILVAFDDEHGNSIESEFITDHRLKNFNEKNQSIHYEKMIYSNIVPKRIVYWGYTEKYGWVERVEIKI